MNKVVINKDDLVIGLLKRVRDLMAGLNEPQAKLDQLVTMIAQELGTDVCSIYLLNENQDLELYASFGLRQASVHKTHLKIGEGVVGEIALHKTPIALSNVREYPGFAPRPETGEEPYQSMMGVPILHSSKALGVLDVQSLNSVIYQPSEIDGLATIAMVIAEMVMHRKLINPKAFSNDMPNLALPLTNNHNAQSKHKTLSLRLEGLSLNSGIGMGRAVLHRPDLELGHNTVADNPEEQIIRLQLALKAMREGLDQLIDHQDSDSDSILEILRAYRILADDKGWAKRIEAAINSGLTAEAAVIKIREETKAKILKIEDAMMRERLEDLQDVANRLLRHLIGKKGLPIGLGPLPDYSILIAKNLDAAELLEYNRDKIQAIILVEGSYSSHVAIVARAMGIPMIGRVRTILNNVHARDKIIVDATNGVCFINPVDEVRQSVLQTISIQASLQKKYHLERDLLPISKDGTNFKLMMNAAMLMDIPHLAETGASAIGLFRTELSLMLRHHFPDIEQLTNFYCKIFDQADGKPITFRSFDIGSDKKIAYIPMPAEENPAMGWRSIRFALDNPELFQNQIRALLLASKGRNFRLMFPMISQVAEFIQAKNITLDLKHELTDAGFTMPNKIEIGAMLEVPSLAYQIAHLASVADFISLGSNDLLQFFYAIDRTNPKVESRYDCLSPPFLSFISKIVQDCKLHNLPVSICGEIGGKPLEVLALIGIGLQDFSMNPLAIGAIRRLVRQLEVSALEAYLKPLLGSDLKSLRANMISFVQSQALILD